MVCIHGTRCRKPGAGSRRHLIPAGDRPGPALSALVKLSPVCQGAGSLHKSGENAGYRPGRSSCSRERRRSTTDDRDDPLSP